MATNKHFIVIGLGSFGTALARRLVKNGCRVTGMDELPERLEVAFDGVSFRYRPELPPALDQVGLVIPPGRRIAVVGESGAGKSTLAHVLVRCFDPEAGAGVVAAFNTAGGDETGPDTRAVLNRVRERAARVLLPTLIPGPRRDDVPAGG